MKTMQIDLPDQLDLAMDEVVRAGWFSDRNEVVRRALVEFLRRERFELTERFQLEDIRWALRQRRAGP
jgi:Arc/MetJ-type ribon-helix-helix transcriptional regulator